MKKFTLAILIEVLTEGDLNFDVFNKFLQGYSFVAPSIIFGENEFTKRLVANKPSEHRPAPGAVDYAALFEVNLFLCQSEP